MWIVDDEDESDVKCDDTEHGFLSLTHKTQNDADALFEPSYSTTSFHTSSRPKQSCL
jgi:hypothetical protein